jgi:hypothetical protein
MNERRLVALCVGDGGWDGFSCGPVTGLPVVLEGPDADAGREWEAAGRVPGKCSTVVVLGEDVTEEVVE